MNPIQEIAKRLGPDGPFVKCMWQVDVPPGFTLICYIANGKTFLLQLYEVGGWDIYIPADTSNNIDTTLNVLVEYLTGTH